MNLDNIYHLSFIIVYNRSWSVFECPVPGIKVCIRQVSPFLPHSYSEASLPVTVFHVDVENIAEGTLVHMYVMLRFILFYFILLTIQNDVFYHLLRA